MYAICVQEKKTPFFHMSLKNFYQSTIIFLQKK